MPAAEIASDRAIPAGTEGQRQLGGTVIAERRLHPVYLLINAAQRLRTFVPIVIAISFWRNHWWIPVAVGALLLVMSVTRWWTLRYSVAAGVLRVRSGLINRTQHSIPLSRITALDAHRGFVQRVFGVWGLKVQTPGDGDRAAVHLACLSPAALEQLRTAIDPSLRHDQPSGSRVDFAKGSVVPADRMIATLGVRELLIAAVTGTSIPLLFAGAVALWNRLHDVLPRRDFDWLEHELFGRGEATLIIIGVGIVLASAMAVALTSLRLARFTLSRNGDRLRINRGLIAERSGTILVDRIQAVRIVEGFLRRPFGYCALEVEVAGIGRNKENERTLFPLLRTDQVAELMSRALPELHWPTADLTPIPRRVRRRYFTVPVVAAALITAPLLALPHWWALFAVIPLSVACLIAGGQAHAAAWSCDENTVTFRWRRILARHTLVARSARVQITRLTRTPWQRRAALAGIRVSLSSKRRGGIRQMELADAEGLLHTIGRRKAHTGASGGRPDVAV